MELQTQAIAPANDPYAEAPAVRRARLLRQMNALTAFHAANCAPYRRVLDAAFGGRTAAEDLVGVPALPVRLFKDVELVSRPKEQIVKTLMSSGTTGQRPSRIFLDKETASAQSRALVRIVSSFLGNKRLPMMILDHPGVVKDRQAFSARGAGIIGFSQFGFDHTYALQDGSLDPDWAAIEAFLAKHRGERILLFGFTFIAWHHLVRAAERNGRQLDFGDSIFIHGGGWKKLVDEKVSNDEFKQRVRHALGIRDISNYYGMVEQTGSIYMECEEGYFHPADYSEILIRHPRTLDEQPVGAPGLIESLSTIPKSYPGHALLTEDLGVIHGTDGCKCSRRGGYFTIQGRLANAELRGCSDTHQAAS
jgi:phenylacetate-coenzyme A ligase PaaK-like adenylate-forming protein